MRARIAQADLFAEECVDIADDGTNDFMESLTPSERGEPYQLRGEHVNRSRLRIDTRKWVAAKLVPRVYGDAKQLMELTDENASLQEELTELRTQLDEKNKKDF